MEAQALMGPDKCREAIAVARRAIDKVKAPGGLPIYMGIKQSREETLGSFVDKVAEAIDRAAATTVTGVGGMTLASRTPTLTVVIDGKYAQASFSITPLPPTVQCLIGRDVLAQLGIVLTNDHPLG
ncbi:hypothetical protein DUI87_17735 [Hirundo rustica rustica]|uniref:Retropepsins domain-containing protein n=1 Tax=Hirundo rustica rustica TaxID=333673 RepID=A0A3M0K338_HIRRU|nr:hypothetical protein DUI87_17735 [Hirundo rustica rustica]